LSEAQVYSILMTCLSAMMNADHITMCLWWRLCTYQCSLLSCEETNKLIGAAHFMQVR